MLFATEEHVGGWVSVRLRLRSEVDGSVIQTYSFTCKPEDRDAAYRLAFVAMANRRLSR